MTTTFLGIGTNIGSRSDNMQAALGRLSAQVYITSVSPVYETQPMYVYDQPSFLNMAVRGDTDLTPYQLLAFTKGIERKLGRKPSTRFGPRLIDIDILLYGSETMQSPDLFIPHPGMQERAFVLRPLADIAPTWVHHISGLTISEMLDALPDEQGSVVEVAHLRLGVNVVLK